MYPVVIDVLQNYNAKPIIERFSSLVNRIPSLIVETTKKVAYVAFNAYAYWTVPALWGFSFTMGATLFRDEAKQRICDRISNLSLWGLIPAYILLLWHQLPGFLIGQGILTGLECGSRFSSWISFDPEAAPAMA